MEIRALTLVFVRQKSRRRKRRYNWKAYSRLFLLLLATIVSIRVLILMVDVWKIGGNLLLTLSIPFCAFILLLTGWKCREWSFSERSDMKCRRSVHERL